MKSKKFTIQCNQCGKSAEVVNTTEMGFDDDPNQMYVDGSVRIVCPHCGNEEEIESEEEY